MKKRTILKKMQKLDTLPLPEKEKILANCALAVPEEAPMEASARPKLHRFSPKKAVVLAMVALLLVGGGVTVAAAEAKEYNEAIDFFEEYNLSAEGFTRSEIKKIYRDIVSESFTYEKTEEALASGLMGYEIQSKPLDSDGLKRLWLLGYTWKTTGEQESGEENVRYFAPYYMNYRGGGDSVIEKYKDDQKIWEREIKDVYVWNTCPAEDKVFAAGLCLAEDSPKNDPLVRMCLLDADSSVVIWQKDIDSRMPKPEVDYILYNKDHTFTMFTFSFYCDYMWIATIDMEGNVLSEEYAEYDTIGDRIEKVIPVGDGYLMLKGDQLMQKKEGKIQKTVTFGNEQETYQITDMVEFNGLVYLSGRIVPKDSGVNKKGILDHYVERFGETLCSKEELTQLFKEYHSAVLLICDPNTGEPRQFYTVPGASGSSLGVKDDKLTWNVNRYTEAEHMSDDFNGISLIYQSGGGFGMIKADVWRYIFNPFGQIVGEADTGKSVEFENWHY